MSATPFTARHLGATGADRARLLADLGFDGLDALMAAAVPASVRGGLPTTSLPPAASEREVLAELRALAERNTVRRSLIGQGYYGTVTPSVIQRGVLENPSWYTAYTPYQAEISQGRLEALMNFQTMVADLTGLQTANASMLDEATAAAEAMLLARRASKSASDVFLVDADAMPQTIAVLRGRADALGIELRILDLADADPQTLPEAFGALIQYPGVSGRVWDPAPVIERTHAAGGIAAVAADLLALTLLTPPGESGADVACGTTQRFGVPMGFGGPHAGYLAVRAGLERQLPGRLVGASVDADGRSAYRLALQTREQHIRREKATSNICTAQVLLAVMASMYAVYHGPDGLRSIAQQVHAAASMFAGEARSAGFELAHSAWFDTIAVRVSDADRAVDFARAAGVLIRRHDETTVTVSFDEPSAEDVLAGAPLIGDLVAALRAAERTAGAPRPASAEPAAGETGAEWTSLERVRSYPEALERGSAYLTHPVFNSFRSETAMMRYLKRLADRDYALDRGMIPLGSCTMKLNAATEMAAISWPQFTDLHPFAPVDDATGILTVIRDLERWLAELTGYDTVSLQPNAGSQGELAGLLAIRGWHRSRGDAERDVCLIPASAHGTNAASAALAGLRVVVVATDADGSVDLDDLEAKVAANAERLAAIMLTYPSTHGVYEHGVRRICEIVHAAGGQVYIDGANLNALVGHAAFGDLGGDVSHLNLHKTFAIPHGGGGPGVGPVAAKAHLAPFLPGHPLAQSDEHALVAADDPDATIRHGGAPVSAAPYGSASILPISWAYVRLMGVEGLAEATASAVLAANWVASRLGDAYPVLYAGDGGLVAHECILDLRPLKEATGVTVDDVAKRLIDYGFHAPTMSFPVAGTLMVEPTESEDAGELARFVAAMRAIRAEADLVAAGHWPADDNPLTGAPHTAETVTAGTWSHAYGREAAAYPLPSLRRDKYWPPVGRVDNAYGDRHLVCTCPPIEAYAEH